MARSVSLPVHSAIEAIAAPAVMIAPFVLGFGVVATVIAVLVGAVLLGLALQGDGLDYALSATAAIGGLAVGLGTGDWYAGIFLVGVGAAMAALTASTRFSAVRGV